MYYTLDDFRLGCTILESLFQSSFECFYSRSCIELLANAFFLVVERQSTDSSSWNASGRFNPLNNSLSTFANRMFINRWQHELYYEGFFQACAVHECTYTRHYRFNALNIVTTFLCIFGGLPIGLRFLVLYSFSVMDKIRLRH